MTTVPSFLIFDAALKAITFNPLNPIYKGEH